MVPGRVKRMLQREVGRAEDRTRQATTGESDQVAATRPTLAVQDIARAAERWLKADC